MIHESWVVCMHARLICTPLGCWRMRLHEGVKDVVVDGIGKYWKEEEGCFHMFIFGYARVIHGPVVSCMTGMWAVGRRTGIHCINSSISILIFMILFVSIQGTECVGFWMWR
jgi:hypothetical protein